MAQFNVSVPHQTTRDDAIEKLRGFSEKIRDEFAGQVSDLAETWDDDGNLQFAFKAMGMAVAIHPNISPYCLSGTVQHPGPSRTSP